MEECFTKIVFGTKTVESVSEGLENHTYCAAKDRDLGWA